MGTEPHPQANNICNRQLLRERKNHFFSMNTTTLGISPTLQGKPHAQEELDSFESKRKKMK